MYVSDSAGLPGIGEVLASIDFVRVSRQVAVCFRCVFARAGQPTYSARSQLLNAFLYLCVVLASSMILLKLLDL